MLTTIIVLLASFVAFLLPPFLIVLIGGGPFLAILASLAVLVGWFGLKRSCGTANGGRAIGSFLA